MRRIQFSGGARGWAQRVDARHLECLTWAEPTVVKGGTRRVHTLDGLVDERRSAIYRDDLAGDERTRFTG